MEGGDMIRTGLAREYQEKEMAAWTQTQGCTSVSGAINMQGHSLMTRVSILEKEVEKLNEYAQGLRSDLKALMEAVIGK